MPSTAQRDFDVVTFGEIMAMFVAEESGPLARVDRFTRRLAGAEFNVAVGLRRLGHSVGFVTRLGTDPFGEFALQQLEANGIDVGEVDWRSLLGEIGADVPVVLEYPIPDRATAASELAKVRRVLAEPTSD